MTRLLILAFAVSAFALSIACEKKSNKVPEPTTPTPKTEPKKSPPPKGVPQELKDMVEAGWPKIEELGNTFVAEFDKATKAKAANDRDAMDPALEAASKAFNALAGKWSEIVYWSQDMDDETQEACARYLSKWEKKYRGWQKKNKGLSQFQRVGK